MEGAASLFDAGELAGLGESGGFSETEIERPGTGNLRVGISRRESAPVSLVGRRVAGLWMIRIDQAWV
jgi:hypothetical protein